jgi:predicted permease
VLDDVARSPGVVAVGAASILPTRGSTGTSLRIEGEPVDEASLPDLRYVAVRGDYFAAMRIPLLSGRTYDASDLPDGPKTAVINDAAARRFFPKGDAIGRRIRIGPDPHGTPLTIVGIVGDVRADGVDSPAQPTLFANHRQEAWLHSMSVVARTTGDPASAVPLLRRAVHGVDPALALRDVKPLADVMGSSLAPRRFALALASCFAAVALSLAAVGIYAVLAYSVSTRTREFGVRRALGATARSLLLLVVRQGLAWAVIGLAFGLAAALGGGRLLRTMLYGVTPSDPVTLVAVTGGLGIVVALACVIPALRATRVSPITSMRGE